MKDEDNYIEDSLRTIVAQAAVVTKKFVGTGEKEAGDQAAVDAMRKAFEGLKMDAIVRVGEGEKDEAPMLYVGEKLGTGEGEKLDIAVDPVEGTSLMAAGLPNAIAVIAATSRNGFWDAGHAYYMDKIVVGADAMGVIDINKSVAYNLDEIAKKKKKNISELKVFVLDKPRHLALRKEIETCGARVDLHPEGDVIGSLLALMPSSDVDVLLGVGGAPEAVITAAAVKALGGDMQGKLAPQKEEEKRKLKEDNIALDQVLMLDDLVKSDWAVFAASGVTSGLILKAPFALEGNTMVDCMTIDSKSNTIKQGLVIVSGQA